MSITSVVNDLVTSVSVINALKPLPPTISGYSVGGVDDTALDPAGGQTVQINGTGFLAGATITFDGSAVAVVTYVNPNRLTFTSPAKSAGTYTIYAVNPDGGTAIFIPGIIYSVLPTWTTSAGSLGSYYETTSISNTVIATGDAPITYSLFSGSLPAGSTLYANGVITGTAPVDSSSTTYSFTIQATDAQLQDSTRSFSLTINVDAVTWVSPANATTYTSAVNSAISNVALSATDAAGYNVSYSANALPTGLSLTGSNIAGTPTVIADSSTLLTATAATTNRTAVRTINWSITVANDVYFEYNTLLIPGASTTFVDDASTNNFAVTIFGDTKPNSFNPYTPGYYSNYFDGTGDYISVPDNVAFTMGAGDFTIECWVNLSTISGSQIVIGTCDSGGSQGSMSFVLNVNSGTPKIGVGYAGTMYYATAASAISTNTWVHLAGVRNGASVYIYVNGVQSTALNMGSLAITDSTQIVAIGRNGAGAFEYVTGYISNVRIVKGTAVYTTTFTPPTTPLTAISGTSLLTCQSNRFIDNSTNAFTVTVGGDTKTQSFQPFTPNSSYSTYGSGYFDGTGDYLAMPTNATSLAMGTGNFTIEFWINTSNIAQTGYVLQTDIGANSLYISLSGSTIRLTNAATVFAVTPTLLSNTWYHIAVVRSGTSSVIYTNGVAGTAVTCSIDFTQNGPTIGANSFIGYLSDYRIVKGTAVYTTAFTPPSAPLTAIANTSLLTLQNNQSVNNSVFLDNSTNNFFVTRAGNTTQGTFSPYGGNWSNYFSPGQSNYIQTTIQAMTADFTVECWVYITSLPNTGVIIGQTWELWVNTNGTVSYYTPASVRITTSLTVSLNTWTHIALVRSSGIAKIYINGVAAASTYTNSATVGALETTYIGRDPGASGGYNGYISNLRIVNGTAVYTSTFTPSTTPLTAITNTSLLTCQSPRFIDTSVNAYAVTITGSPAVQRFSPFNPSSVTPTSYSGYFDGTGDYLTATGSTSVSFGTGDFTIEGWFNTAVGTNNGFLQISDTAGGFKTTYVNTIGISLLAGKLNLYGVAGTGYTSTGSSYATSTWTHFALVRSSSVTKLYINGVLDTTIGTSGSITDSTNYSMSYIAIGGYYSTAYLLTGYLSNIRIVKGVAVYTGAFTVPTSPLTATQSSGTNIAAITGTATSLLTCQSTTFVDNSTNNFTITSAGNSQPTQQNPFGFTSATTNGYTVSTIGGSGYFDGTGDYLSLPINNALAFGLNNFTVELWFYQTATMTTEYEIIEAQTTSAFVIYKIGASGALSTRGYASSNDQTLISHANLMINTWYHIAVSRTSGVTKGFVNGVQVFSVADTLTYAQPAVIPTIGARNGGTNSFPGYISDFRVVNGTGLYTSSFVPPSAPVVALQNTSLLTNMTSAGIYDAAMMTNMESVGDAKLSTAITKFGGSSMYFDGTGDYLTSNSATTDLYAFGSGDFTIEMWLYLNSVSGTQIFYDQRPLAGGVYPTLYMSGSTLYYYTNVANRITGSTLSTSQWYHIAVSRSGTSTKLFVNGTQSGSTYTDTNVYLNSALRPFIGGDGTNLGTNGLNGYIDDLRVTKGYARYTSNFTAPTSAFPIY